VYRHVLLRFEGSGSVGHKKCWKALVDSGSRAERQGFCTPLGINPVNPEVAIAASSPAKALAMFLVWKKARQASLITFQLGNEETEGLPTLLDSVVPYG